MLTKIELSSLAYGIVNVNYGFTYITDEVLTVYLNVTLVIWTCRKSWLDAACIPDIVLCIRRKPVPSTYCTYKKISSNI